ncbi:ABC transporter permease [Acidicapsa ligni]|uniref:ABC transporter permease n=1 Tax=Acidicapsa ligni TaxID=542300 RepID=UPI0021DFECD8|nr:ABC transporter permease [Acidicapsa ligni]
MNKLVFANLIHRPMRSIISAAAIAIEVVMIISVAAIFLGQIDGQKIRTNGIGADMIVRPANASFINAVGGAPIPAKNVEAFRKLPHVAIASPVIQSFNLTGGPEILFGIDYASYNALRPFTFLEGGPFQGPNDVIVDNVFAQTGKGFHAGDTIKILNHPFRISGVVEHGKGGRKMVPIETLGELIGSEGKASQFFLKSDNEANEEAIRQEILNTPGLQSYQVATMREWLSMMAPDNIPGFNIALNVVTLIATLVGFLVIFLSMYTAVLERTREIGILKSMGASKSAIVSMVLRESILMAIVGVGLGIGLIYTIHAYLDAKFPTLFFEITQGWIIKASIIAFLGAIFGAAYPALMAARKDPIDALSYE